MLTKSYVVTVEAQNATRARYCAEFYTGDISDISIDEDKKQHGFKIKEIECVVNDGFEAKEIIDD